MLSKFVREAIASARLNLLCPDRIVRIARSLAWKVLAQVESKWEPPTADREEWRRRLPDGSYEYRDKPPEQKEAPAKPGIEKKAPSKTKQYKHHVTLKKDELSHTLSHGHFSIVSAGRNPNDPEESKMKPDDEFFHKRHEQLRDELENKGLSYTEVVGHYGGKESSYLVFHDPEELTAKTVKSVMVHHKDEKEAKQNRKTVEELGKKFKQDSVLHGSGGKNSLVFTTGKNAGKNCGGKGWKETPEAKDYYTDIKLEGKNHTKFNLDLTECFKKGLL